MRNINAFGSLISYWTACFILAWALAAFIFRMFSTDDNDILGILIFLGPFISMIAIIPGIVGYRTGYKRKKALIGVITGIVLLLISSYAYYKLFIFFHNSGGLGPGAS